jgi:hypothetical protein
MHTLQPATVASDWRTRGAHDEDVGNHGKILSAPRLVGSEPMTW